MHKRRAICVNGRRRGSALCEQIRAACQADTPQWRLRATTRVTPPARAIAPTPAASVAAEPVLARVGPVGAALSAGVFVLRMPPRAETGAGPLPSPSNMLVPPTQDWFLGVATVRGALFTVVDLARFMGGNFTPVSKESRLLTLSPALTFNATLVVSRMLGLRNVATMTPVPEKQTFDKPWLSEQFRDAEGQTWRRLSLSKLVSSSSFLMVGR